MKLRPRSIVIVSLFVGSAIAAGLAAATEAAPPRKVRDLVIRADGGTTDLGYPWSVALGGQRVLVTYYFNRGGGVRHIAGSILEIE